MRNGLFLLSAFLLCFTSSFRQLTAPNERTRVYLAVALVDDHSLSIDGPNRRFGAAGDAAKVAGRHYSDKAPGSSLLAAAVYGLVRVFTPAKAWSAESLISLMRFCIMIPTGLMGLVLLRRWLSTYPLSSGVVDIVTLGWMLGTSAFHYSTAFYGHQIAAVCLVLAVYLQDGDPKSTSAALGRSLLSGAAAGFSSLTEYQSIIPCAFLFAYVVWRNRGAVAQIGAFALGALPCAVLLLAYNKLAFGGVFELPYEHLASSSIQMLHTSGVAGVSVPRAEALRGLLLSLDRGLIATSPLFVLVPFGLYRLVRTERGPMAALIGVTAAYYLVFVSGADVWYAGWAFGPRLLVPVMGLSMLPAAAALEWAKRKPFVFGAAVGCVAAGILYHQTVHVVFPEPPPHLKNPVLDIVVPALARGVLSPNRAAELSGAPGLWTLVFPGMATLGVIYVLYRRTSGIASSARDRAGAVAGALLAPALLTAAVMIAGPSVPERRHHRFADWMLELEHCETAECSRAGDWTAREEPGIQ